MSTRDPGAATGTPPVPLLPRCATCDHTAYIHLIGETSRQRTSCSRWYSRRCECTKYVPKEETW